VTVERIDAGAGSTVCIGEGLLDAAGTYLASASGRFVLFSSPNARAASEAIRRALSGRLIADETFDDREQAKSLATVGKLADAALGAGLKRDDAVVAVGGGVATDLAGFAAAILLRGVPWFAVPTTAYSCPWWRHQSMLTSPRCSGVGALSGSAVFATTTVTGPSALLSVV